MTEDPLLTPDRRVLAGTPTLAEQVVEAEVGAARLWLLRTEVRDVVSFRGSLEPAPDLATEDDLAQALLVDLLDKGTRQRDRFALAEALEGRGAELSFYTDALRIGFGGRALAADLPDVLALLAEQLREPALDEAEFDKAKKQAIAAVRQAMDAPASQAAGALSRRLYPPDHPNYIRTPEAEIARLTALTIEDVRRFHAARVGGDGLRIALVGDLDPQRTARAVEGVLGDWAAHGQPARFADEATPTAPGRADVAIADRPNLDVRLGHPLALRRQHDDYLAVFAANFALGGNFSARLMQTVRDAHGLTYSIGSMLRGVTVEHGGHWLVHVTLSGPNLERGVEATRAVVQQFVEEGIGADELGAVQETLAGQHVVGMATTGGLAARLLTNAERGFDVGYLDRYPDLVRALTPEAVTDAARRHFRPGDLHTVVAGTLPA